MSGFSNMSSGDIIPTICHCGKRAVLKTEESSNNPKKQFWGCPIWEFGKKSCNYFEWEYERALRIACKMSKEVDELNRRLEEEDGKNRAMEKLSHQVEDLKNELIVATISKKEVGIEKKTTRKKLRELIAENNKLRNGNRIRDFILVIVVLCIFVSYVK